MTMADFYDISSIFSKSSARFNSINLPNNIVNGLDIGYRLIMSDFTNVTFPIIFKIGQGKKFGDLLDTYWGNLYLISDKFRNILEENSLSGWKTYPIKLLDKTETEITGYHGLSITGRCGSVDFNNSTIIEKQFVPNAPKARYYKGLYVGLEKWDGSDFFLPEGYFGIVLSAKAADIIKKSKLTNIDLKNLMDVEIPC
jgi:hypothetical protein